MSTVVCEVLSKGIRELDQRVIPAWRNADVNDIMWMIAPTDVDRRKFMAMETIFGINWWSVDSHLLVCNEVFRDMLKSGAIKNVKACGKYSVTAVDCTEAHGGPYTGTFLVNSGLPNGHGFVSANDIKVYMRHLSGSLLRCLGGEKAKNFSDASVVMAGRPLDNSVGEVQASAADIHTGRSVVVNIKKVDKGMIEYNLHYIGDEKTQMQGVYVPETIGCTDLPVELYMAGAVLSTEVNRKRGRFDVFTKVITNQHQTKLGRFGRANEYITEFIVMDQVGAVENKVKAVVEAKDMREAMINGTLPEAKKAKD